VLLDLGLSSSSSVFSSLGGLYFSVEVHHPSTATTDSSTLTHKRGNVFIEGGHFEHHVNISKNINTTSNNDDSNIVAVGIRFRIDSLASMMMRVVDNNFRKKKGKETDLFAGVASLVQGQPHRLQVLVVGSLLLLLLLLLLTTTTVTTTSTTTTSTAATTTTTTTTITATTAANTTTIKDNPRIK